jgi:hypothetical protein
VKANLKRAAIVLTTCLFAVPCWSDEAANAANAAAARTVASANSPVVGQHGKAINGGAAHAATAAASEPRAQREPPAGVEVVRVRSERDVTAPDQTNEDSF